VLVKLGDKDVDVSPDFKLYIATRLPNPTYPPEVTTKVAVINFAVKQQGLEGQLLAAVVRHERRDLDAQKNELVVKVRVGGLGGYRLGLGCGEGGGGQGGVSRFETL